MKRKIIKIDQEKCNGCELCVKACHEGAIGMVNGKATLLREDYCDGLGDCLPTCPVSAITFIDKEAPAYDAEAVKRNQLAKSQEGPLPCGCPGSNARSFARDRKEEPLQESHVTGSDIPESELMQWPVQIKLVPIQAPYLDGARLLIAADCAAYSYADFHRRFMHNHITLIGCPKLDEGDYAEKLTEIFRRNDIQSITVVRMEVPCCGGIVNAVKQALLASGKVIPWQIVILTTDGKIREA